MVIKVDNPFPVIDGLDGLPLEAGFVYIGAFGLDPVGNPKQAYWDSDLTVIAAQPIRTIAGRFADTGSQIGTLYVAGPYSILVQDKDMQTVVSKDVDRVYSFSKKPFVTFQGDGRTGPYPLDFVPENLGALEVLVDGVDNTYLVDFAIDPMPTAASGFGLQFIGLAPTAIMNIKVRYSVTIDENSPPFLDPLLKSGGTMNGAIVLAGDPSSDLEAATKQYVDDVRADLANGTIWVVPETMDAAGIQAAADAVGAMGGGEVRLAPGTYTITSNSVGVNQGTAITLTALHNNVSIVGGSGTKLVPASNRVEMFAQNGAENITLEGLVFDNSANGPLQYQVKNSSTTPGLGIAGWGNGANAAYRQYRGAGLTVNRCEFIGFHTCINYIGDASDNQVLSGIVQVTDTRFEDYAFGLLTAQPEHCLMSNIIDIDCYQALNGNNTDGSETDLTVTTNDPGHALYVTDRSGAYPKTVMVSDVASANADSTSVRVRKGEVVAITNTTHFNCSRFVNVENALQLTLSNVSGKLRTSTFSNQAAVEIIDCEDWVADGMSIDISGTDSWAFVAGADNGLRNKNGTLSALRVVQDYAADMGKAPVLISGQTNARIESPALTHNGLIAASRPFIDVRNSSNVQVITPSKHAPDGVDETRLVAFDANCVDCVVKWSEADLDQVPNANTIVDNSGTARIFRDGLLRGEFLPTVRFETNGDFVPTYTSNREGWWYKAGGLVTVGVLVECDFNSYTTAAGAYEIVLPFTAKSSGVRSRYYAPAGRFRNIDLGSLSRGLSATVEAGDSHATLQQSADDSTGGTITTGSIIAGKTGVWIAFEITYEFEE